MLKCKHMCEDCGEEWECKFPYYSNYQHFEEVVDYIGYCNSFCPTCLPVKRENIDSLFEEVSDIGHYKSGYNKRSSIKLRD